MSNRSNLHHRRRCRKRSIGRERFTKSAKQQSARRNASCLVRRNVAESPQTEKATESNDNCDIEIAASELKCLKQPATSLENSEYGSDGFKEFSHFSIGSGMTPLKINRKLAVYYASMEIANENGSEGDDFIGYYNENTGEIVDELDSSDDEIVEPELDEEELSDSDPDDELGFGDENNVVDTETF